MAYRQQGKDQAAYVVKLLPIAVELIERYKGDDKFKDSPDKVFPVGNLSPSCSTPTVRACPVPSTAVWAVPTMHV